MPQARTPRSTTGRIVIAGAAAALSAIALAAPAQAGIGESGPVTEATGFFPEYYQDDDGLRLGLCLDGPQCFAAIERPILDEPVSFPSNFPVEAFWWAAETELPTPGGSMLLVLAQEAAFANEIVVDGDQAAFGRLRIRGDGLTTGQWYRFTTPYGQFDIQAAAAGGGGGGRQINFTSDIGCGAEGLPPLCPDVGFGALADSLIGPNFLTWDDTAPAPPEGFIADGVTPHTVTGSDFIPAAESINPPVAEGAEPLPENTTPANYFRIDRITGNGGTVIDHVSQISSFVVQGKLADEQPLPFLAATSGSAGSQPVGAGPKAYDVTIRNGGSGDLKIATAALADPSPDFAITATDCENETIEPAGPTQAPTGPDQTCTVSLAFDPSSTGGKNGTLRITEDGGPDAPVHDITLRGTGTFPELSSDQTGLSFGFQLVGTTAPTRTVRVRNTGDAPLAFGGASIGGLDAADYSVVGTTCTGMTLAPNGNCTVDVHFTPQATGVRNATLELSASAGTRSVPLSGVGTGFAPAGGGSPAATPPPAAVAVNQGSGPSVTTAPKLSLLSLATSSRIKRLKATRSGVRLTMRLRTGTKVVRIKIYRKTKAGRRLLSDGYKSTSASGLYRVTQGHATLRRSLRTLGTYEAEVTPGTSRTDLGKASRVTFKVVR